MAVIERIFIAVMNKSSQSVVFHFIFSFLDPYETIFTDFLMKSAEDTYKNAKAIMSPDDLRLRMIRSALFTWILKIVGVIPKEEDAPEVNAILEKFASHAPFQDLYRLMLKSKEEELNRAEWTEYRQAIPDCATLLLQNGAQATVSTIAQLGMEWAKDIKFDWEIIDESTPMSEGQFVQLWRECDQVTLAGNQLQLGRPSMSKATENPFVDQLRLSPYVRFLENGWPYFMLREVMRSTTGLEVVCSMQFYGGQLTPEVSTALDDKSRAVTRLWQEKTRLLYLSLKKEPEGLAYPILLNVAGQSETELASRTSRIYLFNVSVVIDPIIELVEKGIPRVDQIGIATPYACQITNVSRPLSPA